MFSRWTLKRHRYKRPRDVLGMSPLDIIRIDVDDVPEYILKGRMTGLSVEQRRALAALIDIKRYVKKMRKQKYPEEYVRKEITRSVSWYIKQYRDRFPENTSTPNMLRSSYAGMDRLRSMVSSVSNAASNAASGIARLQSYSRGKAGGGSRTRRRLRKHVGMYSMIGCRRSGGNRTFKR
jgi:hypothetical protein